jgi:hypothetical protein
VTGVTPDCVDWDGRLYQEDGDHDSDPRADGVERCIDERAEAPRHARLAALQREAEPQRQQERNGALSAKFWSRRMVLVSGRYCVAASISSHPESGCECEVFLRK